jgi:Uma2 family endonuclease
MTLIATSSPHHTPQDLIGRDGLYELVDGKLVEKQMSFLAGRCTALIVHKLEANIATTASGQVACEVSFQCFPDDPNLIRRPDIAFIAAERAASIPAEGHVTVAPDLAVEVISPGDRINDFEDKLSDYRSAGIKLVWEVNPTLRHVRVHRADGTVTLLQEHDTLTGEGVLPGFSVKVSELMPGK